jgi:hypothetical protein
MSFNTDIGEIGIGSSILGGLTSAIGSIFSGMSQEKMYNYQAGVARLNAQIARQNATYALNVGEQQAQKYGLTAAQRQGQIKVSQAASGLDVNSGSAKEVQQSQKELTSLDLTQIRSDAAKTAYNYEVQGVQYGAQAGVDTMAGRNAMSAGLISAESSILGTAGSVASQWLRGSQLGMWGGPSGASNQPLGN